ncbi:MAG: serine/threonine-protein kinase, partial [Acidimicrobiales bacterium]
MGLPELPHLAEVRPVGRDGAGMIYSATDLKLERGVAVRVLNPITGEADRSHFDRHSKTLGHLSAHPNVVTVYQTGFLSGDRPFLVMEATEGETLADLLVRRGPMQWQTAVDVVLQLCAGLEQAHRIGALHRNLRPAAVLMSSGTPKLSDLGVWTVGDRQDPMPDPGTALLHQAPETLNGQWDERTDLYSLASILYEMIDGHAPFWRPGQDSPEAVQLRLMHESAPGLDPEAVPPVLSVFVSAALSKDPFDRPQSADEFAHELRLIREGRTTGSTPSVLHGTTGTLPLAIPTPDGPPATPEPPQQPMHFSSATMAAIDMPPAPAPPG